MQRRTFSPTAFTVASLLLIATSLISAEPLVVTRESAPTFYQSFVRLTVTPRYVAPLTALLCKTPSRELLDREKAVTGPHTRVAVHVYANAPASETITGNGSEFPVGAVIVKEKLGPDNAVVGIGGMIKRASGYDPANGNWEFFFHTPSGDFRTGKLANCIDCHRGAGRDHVFQAWELRRK